MDRPLVLGTRGSALALWQAERCRELLRRAHPAREVRTAVIRSLGDREPDRPLRSLEAQGIFTAALEAALLDGSIGGAVHSAKDLPSNLPAGFVIAAAPLRDDPRDCLVSRQGHTLEALPPGATIGTGSPRRVAQLRALRPDLRAVPLRGNVDSRRRAALEGRLDAVVLAMAGLLRLGLVDEHVQPLAIEQCLPQAGQGILALETREDDAETTGLIAVIDDARARACLAAERAVLAGLAAGCQAPVAAYATQEGDRLLVRAVVAGAEPGSLLRAEHAGGAGEAEAAGRAVAEALRGRGADALLRQAREVAG